MKNNKYLQILFIIIISILVSTSCKSDDDVPTESSKELTTEPQIEETAIVETQPAQPSTPFTLAVGTGNGDIVTAYPVIYNYSFNKINVSLTVTPPKESVSKPGNTEVRLIEKDNSQLEMLGEEISINSGPTIRKTILIPYEKIGLSCPKEANEKRTCSYTISLEDIQPSQIGTAGFVPAKGESSQIIYKNQDKTKNIYLVVIDNSIGRLPHHGTITINNGFRQIRYAETKEKFSVAVFTTMGKGGTINLWCTGDSGKCEYKIYESPFTFPSKSILDYNYDKKNNAIDFIIVSPPGKFSIVFMSEESGNDSFRGIQTSLNNPRKIYQDELETNVTTFHFSIPVDKTGEKLRFQMLTSSDNEFQSELELSTVIIIDIE